MLEILSILGSATGGGILGIAGNFLKSRSELKTKEVDHKHELATRLHDIQEMELEATLRRDQIELENEGKLALANVEAQRSQDVAASELMAASFSADKATYGGGIVDTLLCFKITNMVIDLEIMNDQELIELYKELINSIIFLTTTAVCWWFGSRTTNK